MQVRPGIAVSAVFHVALFLYLAYALAFHPTEKPKDEEHAIDMVAPPPPPPPPPQQKVQQPLFIPAPAPRIATVPTTVPDLPIPAQPDLKREPKQAVVTEDKPQITLNPKPVSRTPPKYPDRAEDRGISGYVDFDFTIEPDGSVGDPKVIAEVPEGYGFAAAAQRAFPSWKFTPKTVNGKPTAAPARIRVSFKLSD